MSPLNILIIDDNLNNLYTLQCILEQVSGLEIFQASSGKEGLAHLEEHPIDLILVDIQMPEMNGFEFANTVYESEKFREIPLIFLTAYFKSDEFESRGYRLGAFDYLTKPIDEHRLLNKIHLYNKLHQKNQELRDANRKLSEAYRELKDKSH